MPIDNNVHYIVRPTNFDSPIQGPGLLSDSYTSPQLLYAAVTYPGFVRRTWDSVRGGPEKRFSIISRTLQEFGVKYDSIGLQDYLDVQAPTDEAAKRTLEEAFAEINLKLGPTFSLYVVVTEGMVQIGRRVNTSQQINQRASQQAVQP